MSLPNVESEYCKGRLKTRNRAFQTTFRFMAASLQNINTICHK
ncbi:hypothetical protein NEISICOT_02519 [Neisseria sicca ATCC 29256]|uniref:Uncharacterized protein n=1 Tax=Neisseria sicca ATCC 29256 TaxID=547045 RepID=C6M7L0_NEISI|nr:hypothetical protein NEISICOT_02519 [Neisseria sicca ATCC 29256]